MARTLYPALGVITLLSICKISPSQTPSSGPVVSIIPRPVPTVGLNPDAVSSEHLRVDASMVLVPVHAVSATGANVTDLAAANFRVFEDGVEQKVTYFSRDDAPLRHAQPRHHGRAVGGEGLAAAPHVDPPGHPPAKPALSLGRYAHTLVACLLAKALGAGLGRLALFGRGQLAHDQDLLVVGLDLRATAEPLPGDPLGGPSADLVALHAYSLTPCRLS